MITTSFCLEEFVHHGAQRGTPTEYGTLAELGREKIRGD
jgi:hypothetical protein